MRAPVTSPKWDILDIDSLVMAALDHFAENFFGVKSFNSLDRNEKGRILRAIKGSVAQQLLAGGGR